jgi:hypothetical protein
VGHGIPSPGWAIDVHHRRWPDRFGAVDEPDRRVRARRGTGLDIGDHSLPRRPARDDRDHSRRRPVRSGPGEPPRRAGHGDDGIGRRFGALSLPGFTVDTALSLTDQLRAAGVTDLFDPRSVDLSGIAGDPGYLVATDLVHRAAVKVDEKGTEAAAATAMVFEATGALAEPLPITVDRSFIFAVHDVSTGAPLFLGQVIDPTA